MELLARLIETTRRAWRSDARALLSDPHATLDVDPTHVAEPAPEPAAERRQEAAAAGVEVD